MNDAGMLMLDHDNAWSLLNKHRDKEGDYNLLDLSKYIVDGFDFSGLELHEMHAYETKFILCRFRNADLYGSVFSHITAVSADFRHAILVKAEIYESDLRNANFESANLSRALLRESNLSGASFVKADLSATSFVKCDLTNARFDCAQIEMIDFRACALEGASWEGTKA